jgi:acetylornithine deacetylase/succinyl-diaminopimelate desuccinylase-like protein
LYDAGVKLTRIGIACLFSCLAAHAIPATAQGDVARLTASLQAITAGEDGAGRREAIVTRLRGLGVEPTLEPFGEGRTAGTNIVVTLPGGGGKAIVIGAHYDRVRAGRGAVDNGAACAALIEIIAALTASPPERSTVQVVFFDREESGLLGSRAFFRSGRRVDYALNVDIFAYGDAIFATASNESGLLLQSLRAAGDATGLPVRDVPRARYPASDHVTMMNAGLETLGIALIDAAEIDGILSMGVKGRAAGKPPRILTLIHTPNDTLAEVRPEQMTRGIALLEELIRAIDRRD